MKCDGRCRVKRSVRSPKVCKQIGGKQVNKRMLSDYTSYFCDGIREDK